MYSSIVHPTDLSEASIPALKTAHQLAKRLGVPLSVCYIAHPPMISDGTVLTDPKSGDSRDIAAEINAIQPLEHGVERKVRIITLGQTTDVKKLLEVVETMDGDLMVIGMHKKKGVRGLVGTSISEDVIREAHRDVLVVKSQVE